MKEYTHSLPVPHALARLWPLWKQFYFLADFPTCVQQCIKCMFDKCLLKIIKIATLSLGVYALCQVFPIILFSPHSKPVRYKLYPPHVYRSGNGALYGLAACRSSYFSMYYYSIVSKPRGLNSNYTYYRLHFLLEIMGICSPVITTWLWIK